MTSNIREWKRRHISCLSFPKVTPASRDPFWSRLTFPVLHITVDNQMKWWVGHSISSQFEAISLFSDCPFLDHENEMFTMKRLTIIKVDVGDGWS
jgi:hypothetical protein